MTRHFQITEASGAMAYASVSGDQPDPVAPEGGSVTVLDAAPVLAAPVLSLPMLKIDAKQQIDARAEQIRCLVLTQGAGQALVYERKRAEAAAYLAGQPGPFPMLQSEVGITSPDIASQAALVADISAQWVALAAAIETVRLGGKMAVEAAGSAEQVVAVIDAIVWPL